MTTGENIIIISRFMGTLIIAHSRDTLYTAPHDGGYLIAWDSLLKYWQAVRELSLGHSYKNILNTASCDRISDSLVSWQVTYQRRVI